MARRSRTTRGVVEERFQILLCPLDLQDLSLERFPQKGTCGERGKHCSPSSTGSSALPGSFCSSKTRTSRLPAPHLIGEERPNGSVQQVAGGSGLLSGLGGACRRWDLGRDQLVIWVEGVGCAEEASLLFQRPSIAIQTWQMVHTWEAVRKAVRKGWKTLNRD